jgi:hypothetical protein
VPGETEHIGSLLLEEGLLTRRDLERAAAAQAESGLPLTRVLVEEHIVAEADLVRVLARHAGIEYVNLAETPSTRRRRRSCPTPWRVATP